MSPDTVSKTRFARLSESVLPDTACWTQLRNTRLLEHISPKHGKIWKMHPINKKHPSHSANECLEKSQKLSHHMPSWSLVAPKAGHIKAGRSDVSFWRIWPPRRGSWELPRKHILHFKTRVAESRLGIARTEPRARKYYIHKCQFSELISRKMTCELHTNIFLELISRKITWHVFVVWFRELQGKFVSNYFLGKSDFSYMKNVFGINSQ